MPISYQIDRVHREIRTTVTGIITVHDIWRHYENAEREQALSYVELIDARRAPISRLSGADIWDVASRVRWEGVNANIGKRAVVVDSTLSFAMTRMFAAVVSDVVPLRAFFDAASAEAWLSERKVSKEI